MIHHSPNSSNVASIEFPDDEDPGTLRVTFQSGRVYDYADVPRSIYDALVAEDESGGSIGSALRRLVINGGFDATEVV